MRSVELFAGAGGLAIGMAAAGFQHAAVIEWDRDACETFRDNQRHGRHVAGQWPVYEGDVRDFDYSQIRGAVDVVSGGPPCQPFSLGGKHRGYRDNRDMFPEAVRAVRDLRPDAFIFENVRGLLRESFSSYFGYVVLQLAHPYHIRRPRESWRQHLGRLERLQTSGRDPNAYNVVFRLLNAVDYGVPQRRQRVFIVGFRADLGIAWEFPRAEHSEDALLYDQWVTGEYWDRHRVAKRRRPLMRPELAPRVERLSYSLLPPHLLPWRTVRDGIGSLPAPNDRRRGQVANHVFMPGARTYPGHTGSPFDEPAKTLKAGAHGVPGGENMLVLEGGEVRYFTVREAARLQTFPDDYVFHGSWSESMRQLGNAVPVTLAGTVAASVARVLEAKARDGR